MTPRAAVIGAGWAGLSAAVHLRDAGWEVDVFEAAHTPGGRAQRVSREGFAAPLDNGQHLMLGAYSATLALMQRLHGAPDVGLWRMPLTLASADGSFTLRAPRLPAPLHAAAALLGARGLRLADRLAAVRLVRALQARQWRAPQASVSVLLQSTGQPQSVREKLWLPLCIAALNTPPDQACAQLFCNVLRDTLDAPRHASDLLLPRTDMSALWPTAAAALCRMHYGHAVRRLQPQPDAVAVDGQRFDAAVLAVAPRVAARLLAPLASSLPVAESTPESSPASRLGPLLESLRRFTYLPIATLTVQLAQPMAPLQWPLLMLREDPAAGRHGQWMFDRTRLLGLDPARPELTLVASDAKALVELPREQAMARLIAQLQAELNTGPVAHSELIIDKHATFAAVPGLVRPANATPWPRLALAGDWTDTGYPGVLEGAVRSGIAAARNLCRMYSPAPATRAAADV